MNLTTKRPAETAITGSAETATESPTNLTINSISRQVLHVFTLGMSMLGWHRVPTGSVLAQSFGASAEPVLSLFQHGKWVPDVNTLITIV